MNGLWTAEFGTSSGMFGGGVAVFLDGKVLGGDGTHFYVGDYKFTGNDFQATLRVAPFIEGSQSVFNTFGQELTLDLKGTLVSDRIATAHGFPRGMADRMFGVKLTKRD